MYVSLYWKHPSEEIIVEGGLPMNDWNEQQQWMERVKLEIESRLERTEEYGLRDSLGMETGELSVFDNHPADIGSEVFERGKDLGLRTRDFAQLDEIDMAMKAIADGTYGTCAHCHQLIAMERLQVHPATTLCVNCKAAQEIGDLQYARPIEEQVSLHPESK